MVSLPPRGNYARDQLITRFCRVDVEIIPVIVVGLQVIARFTDVAIAAFPFSTLELLNRSVDANPEHIKIRQQMVQLICPTLFLDNVLDDQIISRLGESGDRAMKTIKEPVALA